VIITFVPEPCPDDCGGSKRGYCVNVTCNSNAPTPAGYKTKYGCVDPINGIIKNGHNTSKPFCYCFKGAGGVNCVGGKSNLGKIIGISVGAIVGIVIACAVVFVVLAFATKKAVDYALLDTKAMSTAKENPLHIPAGNESSNRLYQDPEPRADL